MPSHIAPAPLSLRGSLALLGPYFAKRRASLVLIVGLAVGASALAALEPLVIKTPAAVDAVDAEAFCMSEWRNWLRFTAFCMAMLTLAACSGGGGWQASATGSGGATGVDTAE